MVKINLEEKAQKAHEKYPNEIEYLIKFMLAGGKVGSSGKYDDVEMADILINIGNLLKIKETLTNISEVALLLGNRGTEFMNEAFDVILSDELDNINSFADLFEFIKKENK